MKRLQLNEKKVAVRAKVGNAMIMAAVGHGKINQTRSSESNNSKSKKYFCYFVIIKHELSYFMFVPDI